jgi:hypothetical protein
VAAGGRSPPRDLRPASTAVSRRADAAPAMVAVPERRATSADRVAPSRGAAFVPADASPGGPAFARRRDSRRPPRGAATRTSPRRRSRRRAPRTSPASPTPITPGRSPTVPRRTGGRVAPRVCVG